MSGYDLQLVKEISAQLLFSIFKIIKKRKKKKKIFLVDLDVISYEFFIVCQCCGCSSVLPAPCIFLMIETRHFKCKNCNTISVYAPSHRQTLFSFTLVTPFL